jgi:DNA-directed RNA polymerase subunit K/omega
MSDDEYFGDDGDAFTDAGDAYAEEDADAGEPLVPAGEQPDGGDADSEDDAGYGLDEDAAGTDVDEDSDGDGESAGAPRLHPEQKAHPEAPAPDPLLRASNRALVARIVPPDERVTDGRLHRTEAAYVIAMRAQQIARHATCFTEGHDLHDPVALAFKELLDRRCPFILRRQVGVGPAGEPIVEEWAVREMALPPLTPPGSLGAGARA